jgi:hypothetical protein
MQVGTNPEVAPDAAATQHDPLCTSPMRPEHGITARQMQQKVQKRSAQNQINSNTALYLKFMAEDDARENGHMEQP